VTAPPTAREVRYLVFSASLRTASLNGRLADLVVAEVGRRGGLVDRAAMTDFDCPSFDADAEAEGSPPDGALELRRRLESCDAFVIVSPEYNASMPGALKNALDWTSRFSPQPFNERHALLLSASPSMVGGNRGLWALRVPLEHLGSRVYPAMYSLAQADRALDEHGGLADAQLAARFSQTIGAFMDLVEASVNYPCAKLAWVEFLGERTEPSYDRSQDG
jgi:chromate reductase, NAD(P)H dehydrogenase (quinone)